MILKSLFLNLYNYLRNYNLFASESRTNDDDADESQETTIILKCQQYSTWLYVLLLVVSIYVIFLVAFMAPQTLTTSISRITPTIFHQLHRQHGKTLSCPCSTIAVPYKTFVFNIIKFHPICSSVFITQQWIEALYLLTASSFDVLDFRKTAHSQFKLLSRLCAISNETISLNQENIDNTEFLSLNLLPLEQVQGEVMATVELLKNSAINRIISFINYLRIITRTNYFVSALNTNLVIRIDFNRKYLYGSWIEFYNDTYNSQEKTKVTCGNANPIRPAGFYEPSNDWYAGRYSPDNKIDCFGSVSGFFAGCTPLEALLPSTLDCLHDIKCVTLLLEYFPTLNQTHFNWTDHLLSGKQRNISLNDYLLNLFLEEWTTKVNYSLYFDQCAATFCTYTDTEKTNFFYAVTLLISLYGGLVLIFRLIVPFMVNTVSKIKGPQRNITFNSGSIKKIVIKSTKRAKQLNLFRDENQRTEESIRQQKLTTRVYLGLLIGAFLILVLFTSLKADTITIIVPNPSLDNYKILQNLNPDGLKCPCSTMTIPYHRFLSLSPILHEVCSSVFVHESWISILMSIISQSISIDWRNQAGSQFQLLSDLCYLANKTIEDAIRRFLVQSFITSNVLNKDDFETQLNATLDQFIESTTTYFVQIIDTVNLLIQVDQPLIQSGASKSTPLRNMFITPLPDNRDLWNTTGPMKLIYSLPETRDINSTLISCICATNPHCQSLVGIYNNDEFNGSPESPDLAYIVPGFIASCFVIDSLMYSTLECIYSHSDCISIIISYIQEPYHRSTDYPRSIDVQPLVYDPLSSRFNPKVTVASIVRELMIEKWNPSVSYHQYYELCAPSYCTYSILRAKTSVEIIILLLSSIGGLCASLRLITPYILQIIHRLFKYTDQRRAHCDQQQQQQQQQEYQQVQLTWANRLKVVIQQLISFLYTKLVTLNIFAVENFGSNIDRITALRMGQWTTRLYLILLTVGIAILALYTVIRPQTLTETFEKPSFNEYNHLKQVYGDKFQCSCSLIASKYNHFIKIEPVFHQICSSKFVSDQWQANLIAGLSSDLSNYSLEDYRRFLPAHLQFLQRLCQLSIQSVNHSIDQFLSSLFVTSQLQSRTHFHTHLHSQIKHRESNVSNSLSQLLNLSGDINSGNAIISTYATNFHHVEEWHKFRAHFVESEALIYDNNCSCGLYQNCTTQANFIERNSSTKISIKGLKMGCTPSESFRASTLECFYDSSCIDLMYQYTNYTNMIQLTYDPVPLFTNISSRFSINTTIAQLTNDLFTEVWKTTINYSSYFEQCSPSVCSYTYVQKLNSLYTITLLLALHGGLSLVLQWICPKLVRIVVKIYQHWKRRTNTIQPIEIIHTNVQYPITSFESISTNIVSSTRVMAPVRCSLKIILTCLFVLSVIGTLTTFSIYFIRQAENQMGLNVFMSNMTTNSNSNLTTTTTTTASTSTSIITTTTMSMCQLEFQPIAIKLNTKYQTTSPVVADFNGDGQSDVAVLIDFGTRVKVLLGNSNGTFTSQMTLPELNPYHSIAVGDFNNDRHIDLVFSGMYDTFLGVWLGNGDGTFGPSILFRSGYGDSHGDIFVGHFNKDKYLDVVISLDWYGHIYVCLGNGNGSFIPKTVTVIEIDDAKVSMNVGDFNNDSYSDIIVSNSHRNYIVVLLAYGDGTFKRQKRMFTGPNFAPKSLAVGHLNGDTQLDIAVLYHERDSVSIMFGYGDGTFSMRTNFPVEKRFMVRPSIVLHDLNEDGLLDIITDGTSPYCIDVLFGHSNGNFVARRVFSIESRSSMESGLIVGDFNGDGHQDILGAKSDAVHLNVLLNTCNCCASSNSKSEDIIYQ